MKAPERIYVEVCEDGIFAFPEPPFEESVEYVRADIVEQPVEGLEEEIATWIPAHISGGDDEPSVSEIARHFAEWGAEHLKK